MSLPDFRPLTPQADDSRRGDRKTLTPDRKKGEPLLIASYDVTCVRGELIGIALESHAVDKRGKPCRQALRDDETDSFILPAVRARVEWGIGGASFLAFCDFRLGTQIAVVAENVRVCAEYVTHRCCFENMPDPKKCDLPCFSLAAGFGYGYHGHNSNSARFTDLVCLEPGEKKLVPIPPFASSLTVQPINNGNCDVSVVGFCTTPKVIYEVRTPLTNMNQNNIENALPLYNGAESLIVENKNPAGPLAAFVIFGLAL